jgi:predicted HTH domain antitoxin
MTIEISDIIIKKAGLSEEDIQLRLAILLFEEELLTLGQASKIAGLHQVVFQKELAKRKIAIHYDEDDFEKDWQTIKQF